MDINIVSRLKEASEKHPLKKAIIIDSDKKKETVTYRELFEKTDSFSKALLEKGIRPKDRVIVMVPMSIELYIALLGIIKIGGIAVFADPWVSPFQMAKFCSYAAPKAYIGGFKAHILRLFKKDLLNIDISVFSGNHSEMFKNSIAAMTKNSKGSNLIYQASKNDSALITFTSGSSGIPKGADRTHGFLNNQYEILTKEFSNNQNDVDMTSFPVFALKNLGQGITTIIPDADLKKISGIKPEKIIAQIKKHKVNTITASPPFFKKMEQYLSMNNFVIEIDRIITGGAPVAKDDVIKWKKVFKNSKIFIAYGSTEAEPVSAINADEKILYEDNPLKGICTGRIIENVEAAIIDLKDQPSENFDKPCINKKGELVVTGPHVCKGYYKNPEADLENKLKDKKGRIWHKMGDTGYIDKENRFWLTGRVHSVFYHKNTLIEPGIIENIIYNKFQNVKQVAVLKTDKEPVVIISYKKSLPDQTAVRKELKKYNYDFKVIITQKNLPVDPRHNSKTDYKKLKKIFNQYKQ